MRRTVGDLHSIRDEDIETDLLPMVRRQRHTIIVLPGD
jgi:hypothetical protein